MAPLSEWQPIDTAPKDGTRLAAVGFYPGEKRPIVGYIYWWVSPSGVGHWMGTVNIPTHWIHLPPSQDGRSNGDR